MNVQSAPFSDGVPNEVNTETRFLELSYELTATAAIENWTSYSILYNAPRETLSALALGAPNIFRAGIGATPLRFDQFVGGRNLSSLGEVTGSPELSQEKKPPHRRYDFVPRAQIFARLTAEAAAQVELDRIEIACKATSWAYCRPRSSATSRGIRFDNVAAVPPGLGAAALVVPLPFSFSPRT